MIKSKLLILILLTFPIVNMIAQEPDPAPVSTIGNEVTTGATISVPITCVDFTDIGSCNMQVLYDPAIALATSVSIGTGVAGNINYNVTVPGVITFGWYTWPGINMPDNSVIFNLNFTKVTSGVSAITWNDTYGDRQWSNGSSEILDDLPLVDYYLPGSLTFQGDAPIISAPIVVACPDENIDIPITVESFNTIGAMSLTLLFDAAVIEFQSFTNNSGFPGMGVQNPSTGNITMAGFDPVAGVTLPDDAILFTIHFNYLGGSTDLEWYDDGSSCESSGPYPDYNALIDTPQSTYYINGSITECPQFEIKIYLQGLYNSANGNMNKAQDWNGGQMVDKYPGTVADVITVELHDGSNYPTVAHTIDDVALNQNGTLVFGLTSNYEDDFYITLIHRNHLETVSKTSVSFTAGGGAYDFSTAANKAYGDNLMDLGSGVWGIFGGDVEQSDGEINTLDRELINDGYVQSHKGYLPTDINGDGYIDLIDREIANDAYVRTVQVKKPQ